jgi:MinD-like ATPase involved in chromosome partitioning or flagellar assembly
MNPDNLLHPHSVSISDIIYDEKEELLMVMYSNGKIEEFYGVIKEMYEEFRQSFFKEKYFNDYIKNVYDYYFVKA